LRYCIQALIWLTCILCIIWTNKDYTKAYLVHFIPEIPITYLGLVFSSDSNPLYILIYQFFIIIISSFTKPRKKYYSLEKRSKWMEKIESNLAKVTWGKFHQHVFWSFYMQRSQKWQMTDEFTVFLHVSVYSSQNSSWNSSQNEFFAKIKIQFWCHFLIIFGKFGIEQILNIP